MKKEMFKGAIFGLIVCALFSFTNVFALPTGEDYSEAATKKYQLGTFSWGSGSFALYGHNGIGNFSADPQLQNFRNGRLSLYTYTSFDDNSPRTSNYTISFSLNYSLDPTHKYRASSKMIISYSEFNYYFR